MNSFPGAGSFPLPRPARRPAKARPGTKSRRLLPIGKFTARAGVGVQTPHYYERLGLPPEPERSAAFSS